MNGEVRALSRAKNAAIGQVTMKHRTLPEQDRKLASRREIRDISRDWRDLNTNSTKDMWQAIQNIIGYKCRSVPIKCEATLPNKLNSFCARFDILNKESAVKSM